MSIEAPSTLSAEESTSVSSCIKLMTLAAISTNLIYAWRKLCFYNIFYWFIKYLYSRDSTSPAVYLCSSFRSKCNRDQDVWQQHSFPESCHSIQVQSPWIFYEVFILERGLKKNTSVATETQCFANSILEWIIWKLDTHLLISGHLFVQLNDQFFQGLFIEFFTLHAIKKHIRYKSNIFFSKDIFFIIHWFLFHFDFLWFSRFFLFLRVEYATRHFWIFYLPYLRSPSI